MKNFFNKFPKCLSKFKLKKAEDNIASSWNSGLDFITQKIHCECDNDSFLLKTSNTITTTGFFKKKKQVEHLAPVFVSCSKCQNEKLLFDPKIHGWDGEQGASTSRVGENPPELFGTAPGNVYVIYSYQNGENYQDLIDDGCTNPEDFFDTFTIYFRSDSLIEVVSYECA